MNTQVHHFWSFEWPIWKNNHLHIGIAGKCGIGKSTLVNTLRNLKPKEEGAAKTSDKDECTMEPTPYEYHPFQDSR